MTSSRGTASSRLFDIAAFVIVAAMVVGPLSHGLSAEQPEPIDLHVLTHGASAFPQIWRPYEPVELPSLNLRNGPLLAKHVVDGRLRMSFREFLQLVVENNLDLQSVRYDYAVAQVDLLRAQSGQAARGTPSSPLPAGLFAGAIGAGVNANAGLSSGGTGPAVITAQGRAVFVGPRGNFDPMFSMNVSYDHLATPLNTTVVAGRGVVTVPSLVLQTQFQQALPYGTSYSVSFNIQRQTSTQVGLLFNPALTSYASLQVYQPLLNGFGLALNRRFVTLADNDRRIVKASFETTLIDRLAAAANEYWQLIALRENVRVAQQTVAAAQQVYDENRQRADVGVMTQLDVVAAASQLASSRVQLVTAQTRAQQQEVLLKTYISQVSDRAVDDVPVEPSDGLPVATDASMPPLDISIAQALNRRSSIRQAELTLQNEHIAQDYTRRNLLPMLNVFAVMNLYGLASTAGQSIHQIAQWTNSEYAAGVTFSIPVFNRSAQADDLRARLETQQAELALQRARNQAELQVRTAVFGIKQGQAQAAAASRAVTASQTAYDGERERLRIGSSTSLIVAQAERDLASAQAAEIQARVDYAKAVVAHQVAAGTFLEDNHIVLDEALNGSLLK